MAGLPPPLGSATGPAQIYTYVDQLQSCRPEILYPQLVHDTPKTDILKNILPRSRAQHKIGGTHRIKGAQRKTLKL